MSLRRRPRSRWGVSHGVAGMPSLGMEENVIGASAEGVSSVHSSLRKIPRSRQRRENALIGVQEVPSLGMKENVIGASAEAVHHAIRMVQIAEDRHLRWSQRYRENARDGVGPVRSLGTKGNVDG